MYLKVMWDSYRPNTPTHIFDQTNPDGVRYEAVAELPSLATPEVRSWVAEHLAQVREETGRDDVHVMVCFAPGIEPGQVEPADLDRVDVVHSEELDVTRADESKIREAANAALADYLEPLGFRIDHLGGPRKIRAKSDQVRLHWREVLQFVRMDGTVVVEHYNQPVAVISPSPSRMRPVSVESPGNDGFRYEPRDV